MKERATFDGSDAIRNVNRTSLATRTQYQSGQSLVIQYAIDACIGRVA